MTDVVVEAALRDLAAAAPVPPLDVAALSRQAAQRSARTRLTVAGATLACAAVAITTAAIAPGPLDRDAGKTAAAATAPEPSEARLREVAAQANPPIRISAVTQFPAGPVGPPTTSAAQPGTRAWGAPGRSQSVEVSNGRAGDPVTIAWTVVNPALSAAEGDGIASGALPADPDPVPPPGATRITQDTDDGVHWSAWSYEGGISVVVWADDGGLAWLSEPAATEGMTEAARLIGAGRALITGGPVPAPSVQDNGPEQGAVPTPEGFRRRIDGRTVRSVVPPLA